MIRSLGHSKLNLSQLLTLADRIYKTVQENHPEEALLSGIMQALAEAIEQASLAIGSTRKESGTEDITTLDGKRDMSYSALLRLINAGLMRHSVPNHQEACKRLTEIFDKNDRGLNKLSYDKQSAALKSLFKDLDEEAAKADLATIRATQWLKELKADNEAFEAAYQKRSMEKSTQNILTDIEARRQLVIALNNVVNALNVFKLSNQIENVEATMTLLNEIIDRAQIAAK